MFFTGEDNGEPGCIDTTSQSTVFHNLKSEGHAPVFDLLITVPHRHWRRSPPAWQLEKTNKQHNELNLRAQHAAPAVPLVLFFGGLPFFLGPGGGRGAL
jgi:hypothetical protein